MMMIESKASERDSSFFLSSVLPVHLSLEGVEDRKGAPAHSQRTDEMTLTKDYAKFQNLLLHSFGTEVHIQN